MGWCDLISCGWHDELKLVEEARKSRLMLQIISGKFFTSDKINQTVHRGTFYTNYVVPNRDRRGAAIELPIGKLMPSTAWGGLSTLTYEIFERLEAFEPDGQASSYIASDGVDLSKDLAAFISFTIGVTCTVDLELTCRLVADRNTSPTSTGVPRQYAARIFDREVLAEQHDIEDLQRLLSTLLALERRSYDAAMRAIRRYVTATHRLADDFTLAYSMMVMSIEALAADFDEFTPSWRDYAQEKRLRIDNVLKDVSPALAARVRDAVLSNEHIALSRRFREFAIGNLDPDYFRCDAIGVLRPASKADLRHALQHAYEIRSRYVHALTEAPRELWGFPSLSETAEIGGKPSLTFQGLTRLSRKIIWRFIEKAPKGDVQSFDWRSALPGCVRVRGAPRTWIGNPAMFNVTTAKTYLSGLLEEISNTLLEVDEPKLTDLTKVLDKVEKVTPELREPGQRLPMLALYHLYNYLLPQDCRHPCWQEFVDKHKSDYEPPSMESAVVRLFLSQPAPWPGIFYQEIWSKYSNQRRHKKGMWMGALFEAAICLEIAERMRIEDDEVVAREFVEQAVECFPGHKPLIEFESACRGTSLPRIVWSAVLLGKPS